MLIFLWYTVYAGRGNLEKSSTCAKAFHTGSHVEMPPSLSKFTITHRVNLNQKLSVIEPVCSILMSAPLVKSQGT